MLLKHIFGPTYYSSNTKFLLSYTLILLNHYKKKIMSGIMLSPKVYTNQNKILLQIVKIRETVLAMLFCLLEILTSSLNKLPALSLRSTQI